MTLIGTFQLEGVPVVVGDTMLSTDTVRKVDLTCIPSVSPVKPGPPRIVTANYLGLAQKIAIPHPHVVVAWAGMLLEAEVFMSRLQPALHGNGDATKRLKSFLDRYPKEDMKNLSLIVVWKSGGRFEYFYSDDNVHYELNDSYTHIAAAGSGRQTFYEHLHMRTESGLALMMNMQKRGRRLDILRGETAAALGLEFFALAYIRQHYGMVGFDERWGGAFEVAVFDRDRFKKIDNIQLNSFVRRMRGGVWERADSSVDLWQGYAENLLFVKDTAGTLGFIKPISDYRVRKGVYSKNIKRVDWSVVCLAEDITGNSLEFRIKVGIRRVVGSLKGWDVGDEVVRIDGSIMNQISEFGGVMWL